MAPSIAVTTSSDRYSGDGTTQPVTVSGEPTALSMWEPHPSAGQNAVAWSAGPLEVASRQSTVASWGFTLSVGDQLSLSLAGSGGDEGPVLNTESSYPEHSSFSDLFINHRDIRMRDDILLYLTPVVIVVGNLSNLLALFVLRRKKLRQNSVCFYMCAYALANLLTLNVMLGVAWLCFALNQNYVTNLTDWSCRLWSFITNVVTYSGIWFVVAMNIDRLMYTASRSNMQQGHCSVFSAKASVTAIMTGLVVVSIHAMWTFELQPHGCYVPFQQGDVHVLIWPWWSATVYTYLPLFLIISLNIAHITTLFLGHQQKPPSLPQPESRDNFVVTVIVVSMSFFLLAVPATVTNILDIHMPSSWLSVDLVARMELTKKITELLSTLNQVIFGLQLIVCSKDFRSEFLLLLRMVFCCIGAKRNLKIFETRQASNSEDSSPDRLVDYELCNNNEETVTSV